MAVMKLTYFEKFKVLAFAAAASFAVFSTSHSIHASLLDKIEWKTEKHFGKATQEEIRDEYGFLENPLLLSYIGGIGQSLAAVSHRTDIPYEFSIVDTGEVNAFAAPGGFVFVTRGLLDEIDSDDELASVVGHEVGHISAHHGAKNIKKIPFIIAGMDILYKKKGENAARIGGAALSLLQLHYSREDEYQSDRLGAQYTVKSGYDPAAMISFFNKLERKDRTGELTKLDVSLMSHPKTTNRIAKIAAMPELDKTNIPQLIAIADSYRERYLYNQAIAAYEEAVKTEPNNTSAQYGIGLAQLELGQYDLARASFNKALALDPASQTAKESLQRLDQAVAAAANVKQPQLADKETSQAAHDLLTDAVMRLETSLASLMASKDKTLAVSGDINSAFDRSLDSFSTTASSISENDEERVEILQNSAMIFSTLFNTMSETGILTSDMLSAAQDALRRGRVALYRMEHGKVAVEAAASARQLADILLQYNSALPELSKTVNSIIDSSWTSYQTAARTMTDLSDTLNERDASMLTIRARNIMDSVNLSSKDIVSMQLMVDGARKNLDDNITLMRRAALNLSALNLTQNEEKIYAKMFARRFRVESSSLSQALSLGLFYGDILALQSLAVTRGETLGAYLDKLTESKKTVQEYIDGETGKSVAGHADRSLDVLIALAEMDLRSITQENPAVSIAPPAELGTLTSIIGYDEIQADADLSGAMNELTLNHPDKAVQIIEKRGSSKPATAVSHKLLGLAYKMNGMYSESIDQYKASSKKSQNDPQTHVFCANSFAELERYDDAINEYNVALKLKPDYGDAYIGVAYSLSMLGKTAEAEEQYLAAVKNGAEPAAAHRDLGLFYYSQGRLYEALEQFNASLKADSSQKEIANIVQRLNG